MVADGTREARYAGCAGCAGCIHIALWFLRVVPKLGEESN
jgi:hypothetical protein